MTKTIEKGASCVRDLIWDRKALKRAKLLIYNTFYVPVVILSSEIWVMDNRE